MKKKLGIKAPVCVPTIFQSNETTYNEDNSCDRRDTNRTRVTFPIRVRLRPTNSQEKNMEGELININKSGLGIVLNKRLAKGSGIKIRLQDGSIHSDNGERIPEVPVRLIWSERINKSSLVRYGAIFEEDRKDYFSKIKHILDEEEKIMLKKQWDVSHPTFNFPSLPLSSAFFNGMQPSALSVDITNQCNLRCKHCFWNSYNHQLGNRTNKNILSSVKRVLEKYPSLTNITWYGGEPLISEETIRLLEAGISYKRNNLVVTNGTFAIPDWRDKNVHFAVSLDGTKEVYEQIRGNNLYDRIAKNVKRTARKGIPIALLYCINALNIKCIESFLKEWSDVGTIGIVFTVFVPIMGKNHTLCLSDQERDTIVNILLKMKNKYSDLIVNTPLMIELIRGKYSEALAKNCPMNVLNKSGRVKSIHMCNDGTIRIPCALGSGASHLHCRSITKLALYAGQTLKDRSSYLNLLRMYHSKNHLDSHCHT